MKVMRGKKKMDEGEENKESEGSKAGSSSSHTKEKKEKESASVAAEEDGVASASASVKAQALEGGTQLGDGREWTRVLEGYERGSGGKEDGDGDGNGDEGVMKGTGWRTWGR